MPVSAEGRGGRGQARGGRQRLQGTRLGVSTHGCFPARIPCTCLLSQLKQRETADPPLWAGRPHSTWDSPLPAPPPPPSPARLPSPPPCPPHSLPPLSPRPSPSVSPLPPCLPSPTCPPHSAPLPANHTFSSFLPTKCLLCPRSGHFFLKRIFSGSFLKHAFRGHLFSRPPTPGCPRPGFLQRAAQPGRPGRCTRVPCAASGRSEPPRGPTPAEPPGPHGHASPRRRQHGFPRRSPFPRL